MSIPIPEHASLNARAAMALSDAGLVNDERLSIYRELARAVNDEGPECVICTQHGLNCGRFAQPIGTHRCGRCNGTGTDPYPEPCNSSLYMSCRMVGCEGGQITHYAHIGCHADYERDQEKDRTEDEREPDAFDMAQLSQTSQTDMDA